MGIRRVTSSSPCLTLLMKVGRSLLESSSGASTPFAPRVAVRLPLHDFKRFIRKVKYMPPVSVVSRSKSVAFVMQQRASSLRNSSVRKSLELPRTEKVAHHWYRPRWRGS
eukprot:1155776-Pelagomonas_calceolata.AAC.2